MPIFLSENEPLKLPAKESPDTIPLYVTFDELSVATVLPSYILFDAVMPDTVKAFAVISAVVV